MNGEKITARSIREATEATASDPDSKAKPIVAEAVSVFGKIVLVCLKIFLGFMVFGLILCACALVVGLFALLIGGKEMAVVGSLDITSLWVPVLGIFIALIPTIMLIYVFMCLIASRKPNGKTILAIFLLWVITVIACASVAIHENFGERVMRKRTAFERILQTDVVIDGDTTTLRDILENDDPIEAVESGNRTLRISVPDRQIDITVDKDEASLTVEETPED